jgi:hypothetical protein
MMGTVLECGCYIADDGKITRCPKHEAELEEFQANNEEKEDR